MMLTAKDLWELGYYLPVLHPDGTFTAVQLQLTNGRIVRGRLDNGEGIDEFW